MVATPVGTVERLWRYPVKSMLGEELEECEITSRGFVGDRAYAIVDKSDGSVASAKNPRKWGALLTLRARFSQQPTLDSAPPPVEIAFPDGTVTRSDDGDVDERLSAVLGRDVTLAAAPPEGSTFEEVWPDIEGLAPDEVISSTAAGTEDGQPVSRFSVGMLAPPGTFFDLTVLHLMTTSTLRQLHQLEPSADFDVRRYRPNLLIASDGDGFLENEWVDRTVQVGSARIPIRMPTMRCVMTTLPQQGLERDTSTLRTIARNNRIEISGLGTWACAGVYADVAGGGTVRCGDRVDLD